MTFSYNFPCQRSILRYRNTGQALTCLPGDDWSRNTGASNRRSASSVGRTTSCFRQKPSSFGAQQVAEADTACGGFAVVDDSRGYPYNLLVVLGAQLSSQPLASLIHLPAKRVSVTIGGYYMQPIDTRSVWRPSRCRQSTKWSSPPK